MNVPSQHKSDLIQTLHERGFIYQATDLNGLDDRVKSGPIVAYLGFDATASSLHVGSLVQIMLLRWLKHYGHTVIALIGGGTTRVGDPTGKEESRPLLDASDITRHTQGIHNTLRTFLGDDCGEVIFLDNHTWLKDMGYLDVLRLYGRHLSVNRMLSFDSIKQRLEREQHLSFLEFNYMVLQAIDFVVLHQQHNCCLQMGGADQWGNIVCGVELARKMGFSNLFGLTTPLLTTAQGHKMGKTASGAVWLSPEHLSPYDYWQFWRNTHDADVGRFLRLFTDLPLADIQSLEHQQGQALNQAKIVLADQATLLCHGADVLHQIHQQTDQFFHHKGASLSAGTEPALTISTQESSIISVVDILQRLGWVTSKSEARRLIRQGGVRVHNQIVQDEMALLASCLSTSQTSLVTVTLGKKRHAMIKMMFTPSLS